VADGTPAAPKEAAEVLGIQEHASLNEIRQKYHEQIKVFCTLTFHRRIQRYRTI